MKYYRKIVTSISDRAILYGNYIVSHDATVRETTRFAILCASHAEIAIAIIKTIVIG